MERDEETVMESERTGEKQKWKGKKRFKYKMRV